MQIEAITLRSPKSIQYTFKKVSLTNKFPTIFPVHDIEELEPISQPCNAMRIIKDKLTLISRRKRNSRQIYRMLLNIQNKDFFFLK